MLCQTGVVFLGSPGTFGFSSFKKTASKKKELYALKAITWAKQSTIDDSAKGGLTQFFSTQLFTVIPCALKDFKHCQHRCLKAFRSQI